MFGKARDSAPESVHLPSGDEDWLNENLLEIIVASFFVLVVISVVYFSSEATCEREKGSNPNKAPAKPSQKTNDEGNKAETAAQAVQIVATSPAASPVLQKGSGDEPDTPSSSRAKRRVSFNLENENTFLETANLGSNIDSTDDACDQERKQGRKAKETPEQKAARLERARIAKLAKQREEEESKEAFLAALKASQEAAILDGLENQRKIEQEEADIAAMLIMTAEEEWTVHSKKGGAFAKTAAPEQKEKENQDKDKDKESASASASASNSSKGNVDAQRTENSDSKPDSVQGKSFKSAKSGVQQQQNADKDKSGVSNSNVSTISNIGKDKYNNKTNNDSGNGKTNNSNAQSKTLTDKAARATANRNEKDETQKAKTEKSAKKRENNSSKSSNAPLPKLEKINANATGPNPSPANMAVERRERREPPGLTPINAHAAPAPVSVSGTAASGSTQKGKSEEACVRFQRGDCNKGEKCKFQHVFQGVGGVVPASIPQGGKEKKLWTDPKKDRKPTNTNKVISKPRESNTSNSNSKSNSAPLAASQGQVRQGHSNSFEWRHPVGDMPPQQPASTGTGTETLTGNISIITRPFVGNRNNANSGNTQPQLQPKANELNDAPDGILSLRDLERALFNGESRNMNMNSFA